LARFVGINPLHDSWGTRTGTKFIRVYARFETDALRIEFELHSSFLRKHGINHPAGFVNLAGILRSHIFFATLDQKRLVQQLQLFDLSEPKIRNILDVVVFQSMMHFVPSNSPIASTYDTKSAPDGSQRVSFT
jgi:hypothetical protein